MTPELDKIKQTIAKVKALAEQGFEGERESAKFLLDKLLKKHNITLDDIENLEVKRREIKYTKKIQESSMILAQCIFSVAGKVEIHAVNKKYLQIVELNDEDYIEVILKYKYYIELFKKQKVLFVQSFLHKNSLFRKMSPEELEEMKNNRTPLDKDDEKEMISMLYGMRKGDYESESQRATKRIEG